MGGNQAVRMAAEVLPQVWLWWPVSPNTDRSKQKGCSVKTLHISTGASRQGSLDDS